MTALTILICIFNVSLLVLIAGCVWFLHKLVMFQKDAWISYESIRADVVSVNKQINEMNAFLKLTFNKDFAKKVEDLIHIKENIPNTVDVLCDDGKIHALLPDRGF